MVPASTPIRSCIQAAVFSFPGHENSMPPLVGGMLAFIEAMTPQ
jgi:hypothetical protein